MNDSSNKNMETMTEQEFSERLWANPADNSPEFLAIANSSAEFKAQWESARSFHRDMLDATRQIHAPEGLREKLLQIPEQADNDDSFIKRLLPVAAILLIAVGIGLYNQPGSTNLLADDIFGHIYLEEAFYGDGSTIAMSEVNARISSVMGQELSPNDDGSSLEVTFAKDCYIAQQMAMHLVVKGKSGPINVVMIPHQVVENEMHITDKRFNGLVTPASGGTLVIVGNKQEPISEYRDALASSLNWEY